MNNAKEDKRSSIKESLFKISDAFRAMREIHVSSGTAIYEKRGSVIIVTMPDDNFGSGNETKNS